MNSKSFADVHYVAQGSRAVEPIIGFTLIELLVTLTVGGILAAIAVPAFNSFVLNDRQVGQLNSLASSLNYARSGATCSGTNNWLGGWIVTDSNPLDAPLQTVPALGGSGSLTAASAGITFQSSGMVTPSATTTFTVCDARGAAFARELEVNSTGRVASSSTQGISVSGAPLVCP